MNYFYVYNIQMIYEQAETSNIEGVCRRRKFESSARTGKGSWAVGVRHLLLTWVTNDCSTLAPPGYLANMESSNVRVAVEDCRP